MDLDLKKQPEMGVKEHYLGHDGDKRFVHLKNLNTMNKRFLVFGVILLALLGIGLTVPAGLNQDNEIRIQRTTSYSEINTSIEELRSEFDADELLVVLDIDNTILTSQTDLGSDIWYEWQSGKLNLKPTEEQKVPCLFEDAIGLLMELGRMDPVEKDLSSTIRKWQDKEITVFALTSRDPRYRSATERELYRNGFDLDRNPLTHANGRKALLRYDMEREVSYMKGIMMTSGQNKGLMLQDILERLDREYGHIIFVDDSEWNVSNMKNAWRSENTDMTIFHYERIREQRKDENGGESLTKEQADKMHREWIQLETVLLELFPGRAEDSCRQK
jgi:hypothetical protein